MRAFILASLSTFLVACTARQQAVVESTGFHLHQPHWLSSDLLYRKPGEQDFARISMTPGADGWWQAQLPKGHWQFAFSNGRELLDLGRTRGCYAGSHYPCDDDSEAEPFSAGGDIWVKDGLLFSQSPDLPRDNLFTLLTLNLHAYQEFKTPGKQEAELTEADARMRVLAHAPLFDRMAQAIEQLQPDVICLQEVAEWGGTAPGFGDHPTNAARQLLSRLNQTYHVQLAWSHFAWNVWKEGTAVLSRHPLLEQEARYISRPGVAEQDWKSRKVSRIKIHKPGFAPINIYSVHAGWWQDEEEPFEEQFARLQAWVGASAKPSDTSLLCGDFNQESASEGYQHLVQHYDDTYLLANPDGMYHATIGGKVAGWEDSEHGKRIDYLLVSQGSKLQAWIGQRVFTEKVFGRVSDHLGVYVIFQSRSRPLDHAEINRF